MARTARIITVENITELKQSDMEKIKKICFQKAKKRNKIYYNTYEDFKLFLDTRFGKKEIYVKCMHWLEGSGIGYNFALQCTGNLLLAKNWELKCSEDANFYQVNSLIGQIGSPYNFDYIKRIKVGEEFSEIFNRVTGIKEA
jgi:hypothetical protein